LLELVDAGRKVAADGQQQRDVIRAGDEVLAHLDADVRRIAMGDNCID